MYNKKSYIFTYVLGLAITIAISSGYVYFLGQILEIDDSFLELVVFLCKDRIFKLGPLFISFKGLKVYYTLITLGPLVILIVLMAISILLFEAKEFNRQITIGILYFTLPILFSFNYYPYCSNMYRILTYALILQLIFFLFMCIVSIPLLFLKNNKFLEVMDPVPTLMIWSFMIVLNILFMLFFISTVLDNYGGKMSGCTYTFYLTPPLGAFLSIIFLIGAFILIIHIILHKHVMEKKIKIYKKNITEYEKKNNNS